MFVDSLISSLSKCGERKAFCIDDTYFTYNQLSSLVVKIVFELERNHCGAQRIGVILHNDIETYASLVAILISGKTYIPLHPKHPEDRINQIVEQSGIRIALTGKLCVLHLGIEIIDVCNILNDGERNNFLESKPEKDLEFTDAYILFTSGSTGIPKGVPITYGNLNSFVSAFNKLGYIINENDRFLQMFDLTFDLSVMSYLIPLCIGACVYTVPDEGMKFANTYNILEQYNVTFALMVPSVLSFLKPYFSEVSLPQLKYSLFCGEALYTDLTVGWKNCVPNAIVENVYGPTEATVFCLTYNVGNNIEAFNGIISIGKPMHGMEAIVVNDNMKIAGIEEKGELCLLGGQLTKGYINSEKNKDVFIIVEDKKYYRTGDLVFSNHEGNFFYCGRTDNQVKIQGFRIELSEIEFHLKEITGCANVVAVAVESANGLNKIEVIFDEKQDEVDVVIERLKQKVPYYMLPSKTHFINPFPLNVNGKIDRKELKKRIVNGL